MEALTELVFNAPDVLSIFANTQNESVTVSVLLTAHTDPDSRTNVFGMDEIMLGQAFVWSGAVRHSVSILAALAAVGAAFVLPVTIMSDLF